MIVHTETRRYRLEVQGGFARLTDLLTSRRAVFLGGDAIDLIHRVEQLDAHYPDHEDFERLFDWGAAQYDHIMTVVH